MEFILTLWNLVLESSPWLVLGLFIGGSFQAIIPDSLLQKHIKTDSVSSVVKAAILGAPLPLCSCGVIPAALGLRKSGASKSATVSFMVSTPETGLDSFSISYALLGPFIAIFRTVTALVSAFVVGLLVLFFDKSPSEQVEWQSNCCATGVSGSANSGGDSGSSLSIGSKLTAGIKYAFTNLLHDIIFWLVIGLVFSALVQTYVPTDFLSKWGGSYWSMLLMLLVGIPVYVCATASTPIAAGFILAGISPGAALVFLMVGPATNVATMGVIAEHLGKRSLWLYLLGVASVALLAGLLLDFWLSAWDIDVVTSLKDNVEMLPYWLQLGCAFILLAAVSSKFWKQA